MSRKQSFTTKPSKEEQEQQEHEDMQLAAVESLSLARTVALQVFGPGAASPAVVFEMTAHLVYDEDDNLDVEGTVDELEKSKLIASDLFELGQTAPTPEMVFGVHDHVFMNDDEDEE